MAGPRGLPLLLGMSRAAPRMLLTVLFAVAVMSQYGATTSVLRNMMDEQAPGSLSPIRTSSETLILPPAKGEKQAGAGYEEPPEHTLEAKSKGPKVSKITKIVDPKTFKSTEPAQLAWEAKKLWTPNGKAPHARSDIARAIHLAKRSFIIAKVESGGTRLAVFTLKNGAVVPIAAGRDTGEDWQNFCTPSSAYVSGIDTDFDRIPRMSDMVQRAETALEMLTALYSSCKATVRKGMSAPLPGANWGPLSQLVPRGHKTSLPDMVDTWFHNVPIFYEGTDGLRQEANIVAGDRNDTVDNQVWPYIRSADKSLRQGTTRMYARVLPGSLQGYMAFLATMELAEQDKSMNLNVDDTLYFGIGTISAEVAFRTGPSQVISTLPIAKAVPQTARGKADVIKSTYVGGELSEETSDETSEESGAMDVHDEASEEASEEASRAAANAEAGLGEESAFVEVEDRVRGPVSLYYPQSDRNPGTVYSKSFLGGGLNAVLVRVLADAFDRYKSKLAYGEPIPMPCLSANVRLQRKAISNPLFSDSEVICWGVNGKGGVKFDTDVCQTLSLSRELLTAVIRNRLYWNGTSDHGECVELVRRVLNDGDGHLYPIPFTQQFDALIQDEIAGEDGKPAGALDKKMQDKIQHIVISNSAMQTALESVTLNRVPGLTDDEPVETLESLLKADSDGPPVLKQMLLKQLEVRKAQGAKPASEIAAVRERLLSQGLTVSEMFAFARQFSERLLGGRSYETMAENEATLPLLGAYLQVVVVEKLKLQEWQGKFHFKNIDWSLGAAEIIGSVLDNGDTAYLEHYESTGYKVAPTSTEDPEDWPVFDDLTNLKPTSRFN